MNESQHQSLQGWTPAPKTRGTINIIQSCLVTIALCSWTVLCLNVSPNTFSGWKKGWRKLLMALVTIVAPEITFQFAIGQWCSARRSVKQFRASGYGDWSMRHAFLADMGGFVLQPKISTSEEVMEDWTPFPLNAEQVHYLVVNKCILYSAVGPPCITIEDIKDRNKADGFVRIITVLHVLWFFIGTVSRKRHHLEVTILELATIGFIVCTIGTSFFWRHKPMEFGRAIVIRPETATLQRILLEAGGRAQNPYRQTPLDFVGMERRPRHQWDVYWEYGKGFLGKFFRIRFASTERAERPIQKIYDDYCPPLNKTSSLLVGLMQSSYAAIHIYGWNSHFPTQTERLIWRITTLGIMISIVLGWVGLGSAALTAAKEPQGEPPLENTYSGYVSRPSHLGFISLLNRAAARLRNNSYPHDPSMDISLRTIIPGVVGAHVYGFSRAFIIVEGFINLRALPPSAYDTVEWISFLPHF